MPTNRCFRAIRADVSSSPMLESQRERTCAEQTGHNQPADPPQNQEPLQNLRTLRLYFYKCFTFMVDGNVPIGADLYRHSIV